ncbi:ThuA domain-containing protein [Sphingobacterium hotanense]|uniref:ThuA domain-containing protein n=1 Tax=Sphingobacterium hotanense TaxID=649196 RepID=A0ABT7NJY1_9SPHI|nr:ThuA domain-containing protein [Sphingobacterium hotanense]MDM1047532.1 ThuA domain-containing protein [Sphingobacterium hotanense]
MKKYAVFIVLLMITLFGLSGISYAASKKVLIFTKTAGFRHDNIEKGVEVLKKLYAEIGIQSVHSEDANLFLSDSLATFDAVLFFSTTGTIFNEEQKVAFQKYIRSGKGFMGIHAATDTEHDWPWYNQLVGAYFLSHPKVQEAKLQVLNRKHPATEHLNKIWLHKDEWYDFKDVQSGLNVLMNLDEKSYEGGKMGEVHPIAWFQEFEGARMFYTGLGHTKESFDSIAFQKHVVGGIRYVLGL